MENKELNKHFVPFDMACDMEALGYEEPCMGYYRDRDEWLFRHPLQKRLDGLTLAPLRSQALEWFASVHGLNYSVTPEYYKNGINFVWQVSWYTAKSAWKDGGNSRFSLWDGTFSYGDNNEYPSQAEAELGVLKKMIELVNKVSEEQSHYGEELPNYSA